MAAITKIRRLRTGKAGFSADTANSEDLYRVVVDAQIDKVQLLELWVATAGAPVPKVTFKPFGANFVVCDSVDAEVFDTQRYIWNVRVAWKELGDSDSRDQTQPTPSTNSTDPEDWSPTVTRRPVTVQEPAEKLFYEGGYSGSAHTEYEADATAGDRSPVTNSAMTPFADNLPPHQRKQSLWTIRWLRASVPDDLTDAELKLNDAEVTFRHRGYEVVWAVKTAKVEAISLTQTRWGSQNLWEIVIEILHDADGHFVTTLDEGMQEAYFPGEPLPNGSSALALTQRVLTDTDGKRLSEPVLLNGSGKKKDSSADAVYGRWRDFETTDFADVPLLGDLVS